MTEVKPKARCKLCGGKAVIDAAGPGKGYFLFCENSVPERNTCTQSGRIVPGWVLDAAELWDKLNGPSLAQADFAAIERHVLGSWAPVGPLKEVRRAIEDVLEWAEAELLKTCGVTELMVHNQNVSAYVAEWEGHTIKAEAEVARLSTPPDDAEVAELVGRLTDHVSDPDCITPSPIMCSAADALTRLSHAHVAERKLADGLAEAVESAFFAGFSEGQGGTWVEGDPTPAWKKSEAYVVFTRHAARRKE